jgi:phage terminase large subunit GpA-like protein
VPESATTLTMFVDVHDKLLFYTVCAWAQDFTGYVIDYGTYPDQKRRLFTMRDATRTLSTACPGAGVEGAIQTGLEQLLDDYLNRSWSRVNGGGLRIERCLIDSGYLPGVVSNVCHKVGAVAMPSKGLGIRAGNKPMSTYRRKPGARHGHHWYVPNVRKTVEFPHVQFDTNYWKTFVHARLATTPGDHGSMTLFGNPRKSANEHRLIADHIAASESWVRTEGHGRMVQEWKPRPSRPDNHWFDCLVGCAAAASMSGITFGVETFEPKRERPRMKLSELQSMRSRRA